MFGSDGSFGGAEKIGAGLDVSGGIQLVLGRKSGSKPKDNAPVEYETRIEGADGHFGWFGGLSSAC
jgi:hypothetical protein